MKRTPEDNDDDEYDDEEWLEDDQDDGYVPCPHCGETMLEAADYCPACNRWISTEDLPAKRHSWWVVAIVVALIATMILSIV